VQNVTTEFSLNTDTVELLVTNYQGMENASAKKSQWWWNKYF